MDFQQTVAYLYNALPMFQRVGPAALKPDLSNTIKLCQLLGNPQSKFKSIHVAGTNGKGSSSHMLAAVLQVAGYKTGLYTSPHLKNFTERIKVDGQEVTEEFVVSFVERIKSSIETIKPSFFEVTVAMAFDYFATHHVDLAVIEVGMGGRLDSTNVIEPEVSLITNIGFDHKELLGDTLPAIASEKAGIIKPGIPVVVSERQKEVEQVFINRAEHTHSPLRFASDRYEVVTDHGKAIVSMDGVPYLTVDGMDLTGGYQRKNMPGVLATIDVLRKDGFHISDLDLADGLRHAAKLTGLKGRWQKLNEQPWVYCDTAHNVEGMQEVFLTLKRYAFKRLYIVMGIVKDKDSDGLLSLLPKDAYYFFCEAKLPRALPAEELYNKATTYQLSGEVMKDVNEAVGRARQLAAPGDFILVTGSTFVVAELNDL